MKPTVFYFDFFNKDTDTSIVKGFNINADIGGEEFIDDAIYDVLTYYIEGEYGVHDWSTSPSDEVYGIGYTTYEIAPELINEVMTRWRNEFIRRVSDAIAITDIVDVTAVAGGSDYDIYQEIQRLTQ